MLSEARTALDNRNFRKATLRCSWN